MVETIFQKDSGDFRLGGRERIFGGRGNISMRKAAGMDGWEEGEGFLVLVVIFREGRSEVPLMGRE